MDERTITLEDGTRLSVKAMQRFVGRDYVMEYELIKRLEPDKWSAIEQAAVAYANKKK